MLMFLQHHLSDFEEWDIKILATDISTKVLSHAIEGVYDAKAVEPLAKEIVLKTFQKIWTESGVKYRIRDDLREKVEFRLHNLVTEPFFFKYGFDMIFCRNVMIYFDNATRQELIGKFATLLPKGSVLLLGSSESLTTHCDTFMLLGSSIYKRV